MGQSPRIFKTKTKSFAQGPEIEMKSSPKKATIVLGIFFDGTGNNLDNIDAVMEACNGSPETADEVKTRNECIEQIFKVSGTSATSYQNHYTNVNRLHELYRDETASRLNDSSLIDLGNLQFKFYVEGIGTEKGKPDSGLGLGTGSFGTGVIAKTDMAIDILKKSLADKLKQFNVVVDALKFDLFGFSRGAAAVRHFANRINERDSVLFTMLKAEFESAGLELPADDQISIRFIGPFDTVAAISEPSRTDAIYEIEYDNNNYKDAPKLPKDLPINPHGPETGNVNIVLPPNIAESVFHITARHEARYNFSSNSMIPEHPELELPGVHSDIGGGYHPIEYEDLFITEPEVQRVAVSTNNKETQAYKKSEASLALIKSDPIWSAAINSSNTKVQDWDELYASTMIPTVKEVYAAARVQRTVLNNWTYVVLRVMLDAAEEANVSFKTLKRQELNDDYPVPDELSGALGKAISNGKKVRKGQSPEVFTPEELALITRRYVHISGNWNAVEMDVGQSGEPTIKDPNGFIPQLTFANRPNKNWRRAVYNQQGQTIR